MAEEAKVRAQRYRKHKAGDHSMCVRGRCEAFGGAAKSISASLAVPSASTQTPATGAVPTLMPEGDPGRIELLAREFVSTLPYGIEDPRHILGQMAIELARRVDQDGAVPAAIGQLRILLMQLAEVPNGPAGVVDEMRVRHHQRQLDALLATA